MKNFFQPLKIFKKTKFLLPLIISLIFLILIGGILIFGLKERQFYTVFYKSSAGIILIGSKGGFYLFWVLGWFIFLFHLLLFLIIYPKIKILGYLFLLALPAFQFFIFLVVYHLVLVNR